MLGAQINQGTIVNTLKDMAAKAEITLYEEIKCEIANANSISADETGIKINGERGWFLSSKHRLLLLLNRALNAILIQLNRLF